jgi:cupin 2 domain-containing protein
MTCENLFTGFPPQLSQELCTTLCRAKNVRIERIVSEGQRSPDGFWYDQEENECVVVLEGRAAVEFEGEPEPVELQRGSYLNIPADKPHRVAWTTRREDRLAGDPLRWRVSHPLMW